LGGAQCGLIDQYTRTPDEFTEEVVFAAFDALADGVIRRPEAGVMI
jgi:hypothetical protein